MTKDSRWMYPNSLCLRSIGRWRRLEHPNHAVSRPWRGPAGCPPNPRPRFSGAIGPGGRPGDAPGTGAPAAVRRIRTDTLTLMAQSSRPGPLIYAISGALVGGLSGATLLTWLFGGSAAV